MAEIKQVPRKYSGIITKIYSRLQGGAFIATLEVEELGRYIRIVVGRSVSHGQVEVGEAVAVEGLPQRHPTYGIQLVASKLERLIPVGRLAIGLLARHPYFSFIGAHRAARIARTLGATASETWEPDQLGLNHAGLDVGLAERCVAAWGDYKRHLTTSIACKGLELEDHVVHRLASLWPDPAAQMTANPYLLAALADWEALDKLGVSMGATAEARLQGACVAAFFQRRRRAHWALSADELHASLRRRLGTADMARQAVAIGVASSVLTETGELTFQDAGAGAIAAALTAATLPKSEPEGTHPTRQVILWVLDGQDALNGMQSCIAEFPDALHLVPVILPNANADLVTFQDALVAPGTRQAPKAGVVIHCSDVLEPHTLNRLLNGMRLEPTTRLVFTGYSGEAYAEQSLFWALAHTPATVIEASRLTLQAALRDDEPRDPTALPVPRGVELKQLLVQAASEGKEEALAAYREAIEGFGHTAVVITQTEAMCRILNTQLHGEAIADRHSHAATPKAWSVALGRFREVGVDEPLRVTNTNIRQGLVRGSKATAGLLSARPDLFELGLSLDLGYACTPATATLATWQTVIILQTREQKSDAWDRVAALALERVVYIRCHGIAPTDAQIQSDSPPFARAIHSLMGA